MIPSARVRSMAFAALVLLGLAAGALPAVAGPPDPALAARVNGWLTEVPAGWTPNRGQVGTADGRVATDVLYTAATPEARVYVTRTGLSHLFTVASEAFNAGDDAPAEEEFEPYTPEAVRRAEPKTYEWARVDVSLVGARIDAGRAVPGAILDERGTQNFYLPHCPDGVLNVPAYASVSFPGVYPGVEWVVRNAPGEGVHHDFVVAPGADPNAIRLRYDGATALRVSDDGQSLVIRTALGQVREGSLFCHQGDPSSPVSARFELSGNEVTIRVPHYDHSRPLVIDPPLVWSTYYGGMLYDGPRSIWCDNANAAIYVVGYTGSSDLPDFTQAGSYNQGTSGGNRDGFIWKFSQTGQRLWATYYGGSADETNSDLALDAAGNLFVGGTTTSTNFPVQNLGGAFNDNALGGVTDGYFIKFSPAGVRLWASYFGGTDFESLEGVTVDAAGRFLCCGYTGSTNLPIITPGGGAYFQGAPRSTNEAWIARFNTNGSQDWCTYFGGDDDDYAHGIITAPSGDIYLTGTTVSDSTFPVLALTGAYNQGVNRGSQDAYIARFNSGAVQLWTTWYGGSNNDHGDEPAVDGLGNVYLYGFTTSNDLPTFNPGGSHYFQGTYGGAPFDLFLVRFNGASARTWGTYIGGNDLDALNGPGGKPITIDNQNRVIITGLTESSNYPLANPAGSYFDGIYAGSQDAVITRFAANGALDWSTYWGDASYDFGTSVATNADGCVFATGESVEGGSLTVMSPGFWAWNQPVNAGSDDGYIAKFCAASQACCLDFTCIPVSSSIECTQLGGTAYFPSQPCSTTVCMIDCTICGTKFQDLNRDGVKQGNEPGLPGWTIVLSFPGGPVYATTVTDNMGNYCFTGVPCGQWEVTEIGQPGWVQTYPNGFGHTLNTTTGTTTTGVDFGNYQCPAAPPCVTPPTGLAARWVFGDDPFTNTALDIAHTDPVRNAGQLTTTLGGDGTICHPTAGDGMVVPGAAQLDLDFGDGSFSVMTWVRMEPAGAGARILVDKRVSTGGGPGTPPGERGWALWVDGMQTYLSIATGGAPQVYLGPNLPNFSWAHLVVSVDRATHHGQWYLDGTHQPAFDFTPLDGFVGNAGNLSMGFPNPGFLGSNTLHACVSDLALFNQPVSADAAYKAWIPGPSVVFCPEYALMPSTITFCPNQTSKQVCFKIQNNTAQQQSYHWSMAPLPAGPGCTVAGPQLMSPGSGTVTVPAGQASANICVTIQRPPGMTAQNATACFQLTFVNDATGVCRTKTARLRADNTCWCVTANSSMVTGISARVIAGSAIVAPVEVPCDPVARTYQWSAVWLDDDHPDPLALSLNGLPPGEPVIGTLTAPPGGSEVLSVQASYPNGYDPTAIYDIILSADTDGDGSFEPLYSRVVHPLSDAPVSAVEPPVVPEAPKVPVLALAPNPFIGRTTITFSLPAAGDIDLGIYDLAGRLVRRLSHARYEAGAHRVEWDGRNDASARVSGGVYFVRLLADGRRVDGKVVMAE